MLLSIRDERTFSSIPLHICLQASTSTRDLSCPLFKIDRVPKRQTLERSEDKTAHGGHTMESWALTGGFQARPDAKASSRRSVFH